MSRPAPKQLKARPSKWHKGNSSEFYRIEETPALRSNQKSGSTGRHSRTSNSRDLPDELFGDKVMSKGVHHYVLSFELTHSSSGFGIILGVASQDGRRKFGVRCWDGRAIVLPQPPKAPVGPLLVDKVMPRGAPVERAVASRVEVTVDMFRKALHFSIDGGLAVDIGVLPAEMPEAMVPWACTFYKGDSVTISDHRHRAMLGAPPTPPAKVRIPRTIWTKEFMEETYEAGPWIGNSTPFGHSSAMSIG